MESKQLNGYDIEFYSKDEYCDLPMYTDRSRLDDKVYVGLVSDISEELAETIVDSYGLFMDYIINAIHLETAKQSFRTLSDLPYCVITKL